MATLIMPCICAQAEIRQLASDSFVISVAQEARLDQFHCQAKIDRGCRVNIIHETETTKNFRSQK